MTAVVGLVANGKVFMGADSIGVSNHMAEIRVDSKLFQRDEMLIGFCGSFRMGQLLQYRLEIPKHPEGVPDHEYLCTHFIDSVKKLFCDHEIERERQGIKEGGTFMIAYRGGLYTIYEDYQVAMVNDGYDAIGAGDAYAKGALFATKDMRVRVERRIQLALEAAAHHSPWVRGPFHIEEAE